MKIPQVIVIDFETFPIANRPHFPPKSVGVAIRKPGERKSKYYASGSMRVGTVTTSPMALKH